MTPTTAQFRRAYSHYPSIEWDQHPYVLTVQDQDREFFTIGHLGEAIARSPGTIRLWESKQLFPKPTFTVNGADPRRRRRLYTRVQIEGVIGIAREEGLLSDGRRYLTQTRFPERCFEFFAAHRELPPPMYVITEETT